ncbi:MAG: hypothetical protein KBF29_11105 [Sterolibacterium sp.]|nr:hypothetical protein [Sterolibacterium sp.]
MSEMAESSGTGQGHYPEKRGEKDAGISNAMAMIEQLYLAASRIRAKLRTF